MDNLMGINFFNDVEFYDVYRSFEKEMSASENANEIEGAEIQIDNEQPEVKSLQPRVMTQAELRLGGDRPLKTIGKLMIGPVILQITGALYGIISTMWVSRAIGPKGVTAISTYTTFDNIARSFGYFLSSSASTKVSQLFGEKREEEAGQVLCDLMRMALVFGALVPAIIFPIIDPCCRWFGASDEIVDLGSSYFTPICACSFFTTLYVACQGFLQGEGRTMLVGIIAAVSLCCSMFVFETIFLFALKTGIQGAGWATALGDILPGAGITLCYFLGKFNVKPHWRQLLRPFSSHTWSAMRVGLSQLVANLAVSLPGILVRKFIGSSVDPSDFNDAIAGFNMVFRYALVVNCVVIGCNMGYIPAASYANAAKRYKRFWYLTRHSLTINGAWCVLTNIFSWAIPTEISKIFGTDPGYLKWAGPMLQTGNSLGFILFVRINAQAILQALRLAGRAMAITVSVQFASVIVFAVILFYATKDAVMICWCYPLSYALGFIVSGIVIFFPLRDMYREWKKNPHEHAGPGPRVLENGEIDEHVRDGDGNVDELNSHVSDDDNGSSAASSDNGEAAKLNEV